MSSLIYRLITSFGILFVPGLVFAVTHHNTHSTGGIGEAAQQLMVPVTILSSFIGSAAIIIGVAFIFGGFIKYLQHRTNPLAVPLSTVIVLVIMGIVLLCLPLAYKITGIGIPLQLPH
jgi:hypothetical protein